jgi:hypothetical protein
MMRRSLGVVIVLALCAAVGRAEDKTDTPKNRRTVRGVIKKVDPSARMLILAVYVKNEQMDQILRIGDATKVFIHKGEGKKDLVGKDTFKDPSVKEGARATAILDDAGKTLEVHIGTPAKKK